MKQWILLAGASLMATSCATYHEDVPLDEPHATITVQRNYEGVKADNSDPLQDYNIMDNPQCDNLQGIGTFSFNNQFINTSRVAADKKLHFYMHSVPDQNIYGNWCWSYLGFDAENGRDYVIMHVNCSPEVYDKTEGDWVRVTAVDVINDFECPKS